MTAGLGRAPGGFRSSAFGPSADRNSPPGRWACFAPAAPHDARRLSAAPSSPPVSKSWRLVLCVAAVFLVALKLWLVSAQRLTAAGGAGLDDRLFVDLAAALLRGEWLGNYDVRTLAKGPGYPLFIAAANLLHVPLPLAQQLLYAAGCGVIAAALAPLFRWRALAFGLFALLWLNPMSTEAQIMGRVLRQHVSTPAALLALGGLAGLWLHRDQSYRARIGWAAIAGVGLALSWLTREEAGLLLPGAALLWLGALGAHRSSWHRPPTWILLALPALVWGVASGGVALLNLRKYGAAVTVEFRAPEFADAYGALARVRPRTPLPAVPVTRETRERIYAVSPALARLRDYFEGDAGRSWAEYSRGMTNRDPDEREIAGGWFVWALRDAVNAAGLAPDARTALDFYRQLADEVNAACDNGRLDALPPRSGFVPVWQQAYRDGLVGGLRQGAGMVLRFSDYHARGGPSSGDPDALALFQHVTRARLSAPEEQPRDFTSLERAQLRGLERIGRAYALTFPWLSAFGVIGTIVALAWAPAGTGWRIVAVQLSLAVTAALAIGVLAYIHVSSFPALLTGYLHGTYPLALLLGGLGVALAIDAWGRRQRDVAPADES